MSKQVDALRKLGFSDAEIKQILNDDAQVDKMKDSEVNNDLSDEQKKVSKEMRQADRTKTPTPMKKEKKVNNDKRFLISTIAESLPSEIEITNPEREMIFNYNGVKYKIVLSAPRK